MWPEVVVPMRPVESKDYERVLSAVIDNRREWEDKAEGWKRCAEGYRLERDQARVRGLREALILLEASSDRSEGMRAIAAAIRSISEGPQCEN